MREELDEVERAYQQQRSELLTDQRSEWDRTMGSRRAKELEYLEHLLRRVEDYENQLHQLRIQDSEEYNATKIRLENEVQVCEQRKRDTCHFSGLIKDCKSLFLQMKLLYF